MTWVFRGLLFFVCIATLFFVVHKIRKSQMQIGDSIYWILFIVLLAVITIFPSITFFAADLLGIDSPANFIFLIIIFVLMVKLFSMSIELSNAKSKIDELIQIIALNKVIKDDESEHISQSDGEVK